MDSMVYWHNGICGSACYKVIVADLLTDDTGWGVSGGDLDLLTIEANKVLTEFAHKTCEQQHR